MNGAVYIGVCDMLLRVSSRVYEVARWPAVEARYMRSCWGSHPRKTVKNELGAHEFPCSFVGATPYWGKGQWVKKNI